MKFVIYKGLKKITVDNAIVPDMNSFSKLIDDSPESEFSLSDLQLYNIRITSTRGLLLEELEIDNEEIEREIEEGIFWRQETVN